MKNATILTVFAGMAMVIGGQYKEFSVPEADKPSISTPLGEKLLEDRLKMGFDPKTLDGAISDFGFLMMLLPLVPFGRRNKKETSLEL